MDTYYRKARRPNVALSGSIKRPPPIEELRPVSKEDSPSTHLNKSTQSPTHEPKVLTSTSCSGSPAKTTSPQPKPRPNTPTNACIARPRHPPAVKRKLMPDDVRRKRELNFTTAKSLFRSIHSLSSDYEENDQSKRGDKNDSNNNNNNDKINNDNGQIRSTPINTDIVASFGLKKLDLPATPPATPVKQQVRRKPDPQTPIKSPESPSKISSGPLRGVSTSLLDLIRAKEARAKEVTPEQVRQEELLGIAKEVVRIVPTVFTANKKEFMLYDSVVEKCFKGLKSNYTTDTIIECLNLMKKVAPEWLSTVEISRGKFMRLNKDRYTLPQLLVAINKFKREKNSVR